MTEIFPSIISADLMRLGEEIKLLEPQVGGFHVDVVDFQFAPNLTWGFPFIDAIRAATDKRIHVHLMVDYPERYIDRLNLRERDIVSVHWECKSDKGVETVLKEIEGRGFFGSLALNPKTSGDVVESLPDLKQVVLMGVEPGFSGQTFIPAVLTKLEKLAAYRKASGRKFAIAVDGGVNASNLRDISRLGADRVAIASAIFSNPDRLQALQDIKNTLR